jgi:hypothetical protein
MTANDARTYELRISGRLDEQWSDWFGELRLDRHDDGTSTLTGVVADQAQLHGILARLRDLGVTLLGCHALEPGGPTGAS